MHRMKLFLFCLALIFAAGMARGQEVPKPNADDALTPTDTEHTVQVIGIELRHAVVVWVFVSNRGGLHPISAQECAAHRGCQASISALEKEQKTTLLRLEGDEEQAPIVLNPFNLPHNKRGLDPQGHLPVHSISNPCDKAPQLRVDADNGKSFFLTCYAM